MKIIKFSTLTLAMIFVFCVGSQGRVIELFDEDEDFMARLSNQDTPTQIEISEDESFNGDISLRLEAPAAVNNGQRYNPNIPEWSYNIVKNPSDDNEARWIMFAWKKVGGEGIMIQFPDSGSWGVQQNGGRYFDGVNKAGWPGIQLADEPPAEWEVQIRDLFDDFGEFTMTGMALTQYDNVGFYDFIYLAWTEDELTNFLAEILPVEPQGKLGAVWGEIKSH
jgi:hypothetical protein